jgi:hypothetical protein
MFNDVHSTPVKPPVEQYQAAGSFTKINRFTMQTEESSWDRPEELSWRTVASPAHNGQLYYVNDVTKAAVWEKPEPLAWEKHLFSSHAMASAL